MNPFDTFDSSDVYEPLAHPRRPGAVNAAMVLAILVMLAFAVAHVLAYAPSSVPPVIGLIDDRKLVNGLHWLDGGLLVLYSGYVWRMMAGFRAGDLASQRAALAVVPLLVVLKALVAVLVLASKAVTGLAAATGLIASALTVPFAAATMILLLTSASKAFFTAEELD